MPTVAAERPQKKAALPKSVVKSGEVVHSVQVNNMIYDMI